MQRRPKAADLPAAVLALAPAAATDLLFNLSGRKFSGYCTATLRPTAAPTGWSLAQWSSYYAQLSGSPWQASWGSCSGNPNHRLCPDPPQLDLGLYPLREITQVRIDGQVIPPDEYQIADHRWLVRTMLTASSQPTARYGWPTCQDWRLPADQPGTFEVTAAFGFDPPESGLMGCAALALEMGKSAIEAANKLPNRTASISRQGVSQTFVSYADMIKEGLTGVAEADDFIRAVNPGKQVRPPLVYSPDLGRVRSF